MTEVFLEAPRRLVDITIDGETVRVPEGATLLDACRQQGIDTPTLYYLENLTPVNVCRVCVVEVEKSRTLVPGLLAQGRAWHDRAHRFRTGADEPAHGTGVPRVLRVASPATPSAAASRSRPRPADSCQSVMFTATSRRGRKISAMTGILRVQAVPDVEDHAALMQRCRYHLHQPTAGRAAWAASK